MSLQEIKVSRDNVLTIVKENKEKHDIILKEAIEGYWMNGEGYLKKYEKEQLDAINKNHREQLKRLRKQRKDGIKHIKTQVKADCELVAKKERKGLVVWNGKYPEDHGDDYEGTIRRLELSVEPEVKLDTNEFDSYIRNKWTWRESFLTSNTGYVTSYRNSGSSGLYGDGRYGYYATSSWACQSLSSSYSATPSALLYLSGSFLDLNKF